MKLPESLRRIHAELGIPVTYARERGLAPYPEAAESALIDIGVNPNGRPVRLLPGAGGTWVRMKSAAANDGIQLLAISGFRSIARQTEIVRENLAAGRPLDNLLRYVAAPGFSEHHTGRAIDIGSTEHLELDEDFARTAAFRWLERHGGGFGFTLSFPPGNPHGIGYEPWHWFWGGIAARAPAT